MPLMGGLRLFWGVDFSGYGMKSITLRDPTPNYITE